MDGAGTRRRGSRARAIPRPLQEMVTDTAPVPEAALDPATDADLDTLDRRLAGERAPDAVGDLVMLRPSDCDLHMPLAAFWPEPDFANCRALIAQIAAEGGNREPVLVRQSAAKPAARYSVLVGARRLFAIDWLNHNGRPELRLRARIVAITDEEAFRIGEAGNRARQDIAELARARACRHALHRFYGGVQSRMAAALGMSNSHLNRLLALADLPDSVIAAFGREQDLRVRHAEVLAPLLRRDPFRTLLLREAARVDREQQELSAAGMPLLPAPLVLARLRRAAERDPSAPVSTATIRCQGEDIGSIWRNGEGIVQLGATIRPGVPAEIIVAAIEAGLKSLRR